MRQCPGGLDQVLICTLSKVKIDELPEGIGLPVIVLKSFRLCEISGCQVAKQTIREPGQDFRRCLLHIYGIG